ncbi:MAG: hypothetical protein AAFX62_15155 [Pseudomonadota bacterium]
MVEREQGRLRFTDWDLDEIRFLKAMGYSSYGIAAIISTSPDHVRKLIRVHGLDTPLSKSETAYLAIWHYVRDLTRRKLKPDTTNIAAAYMASKMIGLSAELRRLERHMATDAARPTAADAPTSDEATFKAMSDDEFYAKLGRVADGLAGTRTGEDT